MANLDRPSEDRRGNDGSNPLDALPGRPELRQTSKSSARAKTTWLERFRNSSYARAKSSANLALRRDLRKWDYKKLGYADKCYIPRDFSKPISKELERFYGERD